MPKFNSKTAQTFGVTFVNINLSEDDKTKFVGWLESQGDSWVGEFANVMADGYKVGCTWDAANTCFIASMTGKEEGTPNYNCCITARSNEWSEALQLLHFKHEVICSGLAWAKHQTSNAWG